MADSDVTEMPDATAAAPSVSPVTPVTPVTPAVPATGPAFTPPADAASVKPTFTPPADATSVKPTFIPPADAAEVRPTTPSFSPPQASNEYMDSLKKMPVEQLQEEYLNNSKILTTKQANEMGDIYMAARGRILPTVSGAIKTTEQVPGGLLKSAWQIIKGVSGVVMAASPVPGIPPSPGQMQHVAETAGGVEDFSVGLMGLVRDSVRLLASAPPGAGLGPGDVPMSSLSASPTPDKLFEQLLPNALALGKEHNISPEQVRAGLQQTVADLYTPRQADILRYKTFFEPVNGLQELIADSSWRKVTQEAAQGKGATVSALGMGAGSLAKVGVHVDPDAIAGVSTALWFATPMKLGVAQAAGKIPILAADSGKVLATADSAAAAQSFISRAATAISKGAAATEKGVSKVSVNPAVWIKTAVKKFTPAAKEVAEGGAGAAKAAKAGAAGEAGTAGGIIGAVVDHAISDYMPSSGHILAAMAGLYAVKSGVRLALKGVKTAADLAATPMGEHMISSTGRGAVAGTAFMAPIAAVSNESPEAKLAQLEYGAGFGGAAGALGAGVQAGAEAAQRIGQHFNAAAYAHLQAIKPGQISRVSYTPEQIPGLAGTEAQSQKALNLLDKANPTQSFLVNSYRKLFLPPEAIGFPQRPGELPAHPCFPLTRSDADGLTTIDPNTGQEGHALLGKSGANRVLVKGDDGQPHPALVWVLDGDSIESIDHEPGHALDNFLKTSNPGLRQQILNNIPAEVRGSVARDYLNRPGLTDTQRGNANMDDEVMAELLGQGTRAQIQGTMPLTLRQGINRALGSILDRSGLFETAHAPGKTGATPALGIVPNFSTQALVKQAVDSMLADSSVTSAFNPKEAPEAAPKGGPKPVPTDLGRGKAKGNLEQAAKVVNADIALSPENKQAVSQLTANPGAPHQIALAPDTAEDAADPVRQWSRRVESEVPIGSTATDARVNKNGSVQLQISSGAKVWENLYRTVSQYVRLKQPVPYDVENGVLTVEGQKDFASDFKKFIANQNAGLKGSGQELVHPAGETGGYIPPRAPNYTAQPIDAHKADFINLTLSGELRPKGGKTGIVRKPRPGEVPVQVRAAEIAALNPRPIGEEPVIQRSKATGQPIHYAAPPYEGVPVREYNPERARMEALGADFSTLRSPSEWVQARRVISAQPRPDLIPPAKVTDVTAAGFLPSKERPEVTVVGPNGERYPATFDGYQDFSRIGGGMTAQVTPKVDIPGVVSAHSTTYASSLAAKGHQVEGLPQPAEAAQFLPGKTYAETMDKPGNPWVQREEKPRGVKIQFSTNLINPSEAGRGGGAEQEYYTKLYSGLRKGYVKMLDYWEPPLWHAQVDHFYPSDLYVVRDMETAKADLKNAGYDRMIFSSLEVNKHLIVELAKSLPDQHFDVSGYAPKETFADLPNVRWHDNIQDFAKSAGVPFSKGVDYSQYKGSDVIGRLDDSQGCKWKCAFCTIPKGVTDTAPDELNQQLDQLADMGAGKNQLIYVNSKTFGQAKNSADIGKWADRVRAKNPNFKGFIIQTTAEQAVKFNPDFWKNSSIRFVELGIESVNDPILRAMNKPATVAVFDKAADSIRKAGVALIPNIIIGYKGETAETYANTLNWLKRNADIISHANIYNLALYRNTKLGQELTTASPEDFNENVLEKSFHTDPEVHKVFAGKLYGYASHLLDQHPEATQYLPSADPRAVKMAAARDDRSEDGDIYTGAWHGEAVEHWIKAQNPEMTDEEASVRGAALVDEPAIPLTMGFITNEGEFLTRDQALQRAVELGQYKPTGREISTTTGIAGGPRPALEATAFEHQQRGLPPVEQYGGAPTSINRATVDDLPGRRAVMFKQLRTQHPEWHMKQIVAKIRETIPAEAVKPVSPAVPVGQSKSQFLPSPAKQAEPEAQFLPAHQEGSDEFKRWAAGAPVIHAGESLDKIKTGKPAVIEGYHGTTHVFDRFDPDKANIENAWGRGIYVTTSEQDMNRNYAGMGPDLRARIEHVAGQLADSSPDWMVAQFGISKKDADRITELTDWASRNRRASAVATKMLTEHRGAGLKVLVNLRNPLVIGGEGEPYWDAGEDGKVDEFIQALRIAASRYDLDDKVTIPDSFMDGGKPSQLIFGKPGRQSEDTNSGGVLQEPWLMYAENGTGNNAAREILRDALEQMGYDGIVDREVSAKYTSMGLHPGVAHVVAFHPESVKSSTGHQGPWEGIQLMPKRSITPAEVRSNKDKLEVPPFYSQLARTVDAKFSGESMPASQLMNLLNNPQSGVKAEELNWTGLDDFLKGKNRVTKQEVQDYLKANQLQVKEVTKGENSQPDSAEWEARQNDRARLEFDQAYADLDADQQAEIDRLMDSDPTANKVTKFENYQLPGGKNYRELLFQLPGAETFEQWADKVGFDLSDTKQVEEAQFVYKDKIARGRGGQAKGFLSRHWDEPNVVAHARINDRTDAAGNPGLFAEEIQSDWHQKGRKEGYGGEIATAKRIDEPRGGNAATYEIAYPDGRTEDVFAPDEAAALRIAAAHGLAKTGGVPNAPFKNTWHEMVFRRLVRLAAEEGKKWIGWTTGDHQAERYDLSKHVSEIQYDPKDKRLIAYDTGRDANEVINKRVEPQNLAEYVGKDAADKLLKAPLESPDGFNGPVHSLTGKDLKVGGAGMSGFYDKILVDYANKFGKKFGAKVKPKTLDSGTSGYPDLKIHSLPITDEMSRSALEQGFPQFIPKAGEKISANEVRKRFDEREIPPIPGAPVLSDFQDEKKLRSTLEKPHWAIITATQESQGDSDSKKNVAANARLKRELDSGGYTYMAVGGKYKGVDQGKSYLITGISPQMAQDIGDRYHQESVLTPEGYLYSDGSILPVDHAKTVVGKKAERLEDYSTIPGGPSFSLGFGKKIPAPNYEKYNPAAQPARPASAVSGWMLPNQTFEGLQTGYHEQDLSRNATEYNKQFGTSFDLRHPDLAQREDALNAGFARMRLDINTHRMTVEVRDKFWNAQKKAILDHLLKHAEDIDHVKIALVNSAGLESAASDGRVFDAEDKPQAIRAIVAEVRPPLGGQVNPEPGMIKRARALPGEAEYLPTRGALDDARFLIARHGTTQYNKERLLRGWADIPLDAQGLREGLEAGDMMKAAGVGANHTIFTSDMKRTRQTANLIAKKTGATVKVDAGLRPWGFGPELEGKPVSENEARLEWLARHPSERPLGQYANGRQPETFNEYKNRLLDTLERIQAGHPEGNDGAIVTHFRTFQLLRALTGSGRDLDMDQFVRPIEDTPGMVQRWSGGQLGPVEGGPQFLPSQSNLPEYVEHPKTEEDWAQYARVAKEAEAHGLSPGEYLKSQSPPLGQFLPSQADMFERQVPSEETDVRKLTPTQVTRRFPEAIRPHLSAAGIRDKVPYDLQAGPLFAGIKREDAKVEAAANKLVEFAGRNADSPMYQSGLRWYQEFVPQLRKWFGRHAPLFTELLAATSPRTNPGVNFGYAIKAFEGWLHGEYDAKIKTYNAGMTKLADGSLPAWYRANVDEAHQEQQPTPRQLMGAWVEVNDLMPKRAASEVNPITGEQTPADVKFGMHGDRILQVLARRWVDENAGLKTRQFLHNLLGTDHNATIDVWAARTLRRLLYDVGGKRWRILPDMESGVDDNDFKFGQKVFARAASKLGIQPDALQGAVWFAEKKYWSDHDWGRLDLGDFRNELEDFIIRQKLAKAQGTLGAEILPLSKIHGIPGKTPLLASDIKPISKQTRELFNFK